MAVLRVVLILFCFLQNWKATLVPGIASRGPAWAPSCS